MKPVPAIISPEKIFYIREVNQHYFSSDFHFHKECQLAYIIKGSGKRIIGDSVEHFDENELLFIGSDIPHVWYNTDRRYEKSKKILSISLSLFISQTKFLHHLGAFGDIERIRHLFLKAKRGMLITGKTKLKAIGLLKKSAKEHGPEQILSLLKIILLLSKTEEYSFLATANYTNTLQNPENERMNSVYEYLIKNFTHEISLAEVAGVAAMNPNAFCRFFKSRTQKSLTQFINEIRIGHACKLLGNKDAAIAQIAYDCGYNNVSNFNRSFKMVRKASPREYRKKLELN